MRDWAIATTHFSGNGRVEKLHAVRVGPPPKFEPIPGTEFTMDVDLVLLALGFTGATPGGILEQLGVEPAQRAGYATNAPNVYMAGDMRRGQSLVVWAIAEGRAAAAEIDANLRR